MEIMVLSGGAVVLRMEGGLSYKFVLREVDPLVHLPPVHPDPSGRPVICACFQCFDGSRLVKKRHEAFRPHEFTSRAADYLVFYLGRYGLVPQDSILTQFFSMGEFVEKLTSFSNSNSMGYFSLDITREICVGSPCHIELERRKVAVRALAAKMDTELEEKEAAAATMEQEAAPVVYVVCENEDDLPLGPANPVWIRGMSKFKWSLTNLCFSGVDCAICLEKLMEGDPTARMLCNKHYFHTDCIVTWLNINNRCPICRYYLSMKPSRVYFST